MLEIAVLGAVTVRRDGQVLAIPGGRPTELLIRLALDADRLVRTDRLIEDLWGDDAASTRRNTLQAVVARLRRSLGEPDALVGTEDGYRLAVDRRSIDALAVLDAAGLAPTRLDAGDVEDARAIADAALALVDGEPLGSAAGREWVAPFRATLLSARQALLHVSLEAQLRGGDAAAVVVSAEASLAEHPFDERLWAMLAIALYRTGRQIDALAALQRARARLREEMGLEPGPELRELEARILAHDPTLAPEAEPRAGPASGNVPARVPSLVGRSTEVAQVVALVDRESLVTLIGPGGVGKTALALDVARRLDAPGGVWLVRLESSRDGNDVTDAIASALGVVGGSGSLVRRLAIRSTVVVLDNCEHVVDDVALVASRLLEAAPSTRLLCTSQVPLGLDGETLYDVAPLSIDHAVALFDQRARAHRRGRPHGADGAEVRDLCRSLDGLPLAIELAAARTRTLSVTEISRRLDDRLSLLVDPASRKPERQRALGAAIAWSYDLLFADDQRGLSALATFPGGATLEAAAHVMRALEIPPDAALDVLDRLVTRSLVVVDDTEPRRYRLLESIRAYAAASLVANGLEDAPLGARADWFARVAAGSTAGVRGREQAAHLDLVRAERSNIDAVLAWCAANDPRTGLGIAVGFGWASIVLGDSRGAHRVLAALEAAVDATGWERCQALLLAAWLEASIDDLDTARRHLDEVDTLATALEDVELAARSWYHRAYVVSHEGAFGEALALTDRSRRVYDTLDRPWDAAAAALFALRAAISAADADRAIEAAARAADTMAVIDDPWLHTRHEAMKGELARLEHRFDDAVAHLTVAVGESARRGYLQTEAYQVATLGRALCQAGDYGGGSATLVRAVDKAEAVGDLRMAALARVHLGRVRRALGDRAGARIALEAAASWHRSVGGGEQALLGDCLLAALDAGDGEAGAVGTLQRALAQARAVGVHPHVVVFALDALGRCAQREGRADDAATCWREADDAMALAAHFISERDRTDRR